jgi:hypothetical protein
MFNVLLSRTEESSYSMSNSDSIFKRRTKMIKKK